MILAFDEYELETDVLELRRDGSPIKVEPLVLSLLEVLVRNAGQLVTKRQLVKQVWQDRAVSDNVITVSMVRLRKTLGHRPGEREFVNNVHGRGYRFVRPVTPRAVPKSAASIPESPPAGFSMFVGRERVLTSLREALEEAHRGRGSMCVLAGEAGIGKTRTVEMFEREAATAGVPVAWGHCREAGDMPPLWPFAELLRSVVDRCGVDLTQPRLQPLLPELGRLLPDLAPPDPAAAAERGAKRERDRAAFAVTQPRKHKMFDAITRVLAHAGINACVLVLDDLHRADSASLELLRYFIDELPRTRIVLIATVRTNEAPAHTSTQLAQIHGHRNCTRLSLDRLSAAEVARYLAAVVPAPTSAQVEAVFEKSEGNPFLMCELARELSIGQAGDLTKLELPAAARGIMLHRIASLDETTLYTLRCAAVIGRRFPLWLLQAAAQRTPVELMEQLDRSHARDIVRPIEQVNTHFEFDHELLREVLYDGMPRAQRRQCHVRIVQALEQRARTGEPVPMGDLGYHAYAALPDGNLRETLDHCVNASEAAAELYAYAEAGRHLRHARDTLDLIENGSPRLRLTLLLREALCLRVCAVPEAETLAREAVQLARAQRAGGPLALAAFLLDLNPGFPSWSGAREALEDALELLPPDEHGMRAAAIARLATKPPIAFDAQRSREYVALALSLSERAATRVAEFAARLAELYFCGGTTDETQEAGAWRSIEALSVQHAGHYSIPPILLEIHRAIRAAQAGQLDRVTGALERARLVADRVGSPEWSWNIERFTAMQGVNLGESDARARLRALHGRAEREHVLGSPLFIAYDRAVVLGEVGPEHRDAVRVSLARSEDPPNIWSMKVRGLQAAGLRDEARSVLELIPPSALERLPQDRDYFGTLGALARASVGLGALDYAEALSAVLAPHADRYAVHVSFYCEGSIAELLASLAHALGREADARSYSERSVAWSDIRDLAPSARTR